MQQQDLELIIKDFDKTIKAVKDLKNRERKAMDSGCLDQGFFLGLQTHGFRTDQQTGIPWWGEMEGFNPERTAGKPQDYLKIRDDYQALESFIATTLDKGQVHESIGTHAPIEHDFSYSQYISWLYTFSENESFKKNVEKAVVKLLDEEIRRDFRKAANDDKTNYARAKAILVDEIERRYEGDVLKAAGVYRNKEFYLLNNQTDLLSRIGLDNKYEPEKIKLSKEEKALKEFLIKEMEKATRPETFEEWTKRRCSRSELEKHSDLMKKVYKEYEVAKKPVVIPSSLSEEFKEAYSKRFLETEPNRIMRRETLPFDRLAGLLEVVAAVGKPDNGFAEIYPSLKEKARSQELKALKDIDRRGYTGQQNIFSTLLAALQSVQQKDELHDFWLENIRDYKKLDWVRASVSGMLSSYTPIEEKRNHIPEILRSLQGRKSCFQWARQWHEKDEDPLDKIFSDIANICYPEGMFRNFDKKNKILDFLTGFKMTDAMDCRYSMDFERLTPAGSRKTTVTYDLVSDSVEGDAGLESSVKEYFRQGGYPVIEDLAVTSIEGRKIAGESRITKISDKTRGKYEGIIGITGVHFPFIYDPENRDLRISLPIHSATYGFGRSGWEKSRFGLEKIKEKLSGFRQIAYDDFVPLEKANYLVSEAIERSKDGRRLFDSLSLLEGKDFRKIAPYITTVLKSRLIEKGDGLTT